MQPGQRQAVTLSIDPRLLAYFDSAQHQWRIEGGTYVISLSRAANDPIETTAIARLEQQFGR